MSDPKKKANTKYEAKRIAKRVSFNTETEKDLIGKSRKNTGLFKMGKIQNKGNLKWNLI